MSGNPKSILKNPTFKSTPKTPTVSPFTRAQQFELGLRRAKEDLDEKLFEKMNPYHSDKEIKRLEKERDAREVEQQKEDEANTLSRRDNKLDPDQAGYYSDSQDEDVAFEKSEQKGDLTPERIARNAARKSALETFYKSTFAPPSQNADFSSQRQPSANQLQPSANQRQPSASQRQPPSVYYAPDARPPPLKNWRDELPENLYFRPDSEELAAKDLLAAQRQLTAFLEADPRDDEDEDDKLAKLQADIDFVTKRQTILRELRKGGRKTKKRSKSLFTGPEGNPRFSKRSLLKKASKILFPFSKRERRKATGKKTKKRNKKLLSRKTAHNKKS